MKQIFDLLDLPSLPGFEMNAGGAQAIHQPSVAPLFYAIRVHPPLSGERLEEVVEWAKPVPERPLRELFSLCNGMHVGSNEFGVYGVLSPEPLPYMPWDINTPNIYERPKGLPDSSLIVGTGYGAKDAFSGTRNGITHVLNTEGNIEVFEGDNFAAPLRWYSKVEDWLKREAEIALQLHQNSS